MRTNNRLLQFPLAWIFLSSMQWGCQALTSKTNGTETPVATNSEKLSSKKSENKSQQRIVPRGLDYSKPVEKFAFGSCANQDLPMPIWKTIGAQNPDLFLFMGDNIYASLPEQRPISEQYNKLDRIPEYLEIRQKIPFMAIWDDNDYGQNDGGRDNPDKEQARKDFLNYWSYVRDSIGLNQGPLYHAKILGGTTVVDKRRRRRAITKTVPSVHFIMLDTRWNRDPLTKSTDSTRPEIKYVANEDPKATLLGETQWDWLEEELRKPADLKIIVSSIQVIANDHGFEKWGNFPKEREKLFNLIKKTHPANLIILSGDRHRGSIAKTEILGWGTLYDITASSLNRPSEQSEQDKTYIGDVYSKENFGVAAIDWPRRLAHFELKNMDGKTVNSLELKLKK